MKFAFPTSALVSCVLLSVGAAALASPQQWKCSVTAEIQCAHGKYDEMTRTGIAPSKASAIARALDAIKLTACLPQDGFISYLRTLEEKCAPQTAD